MYHHITEGERRQIYSYLKEGHKVTKISALLSRPKKTIYEEIKRNSFNGVYMPAHAQRECEMRRWEINKTRRKLSNSPELVKIIRDRMIIDKRAPDSIAGYMKTNGEKFVCTQTIYDYINDHDPGLKKYLKYKRGYKKRTNKETKNTKQGYKSIELRPSMVDVRERIGDMEIDTVVSSGSERKGGAVTMVDRKTKYLLGGLVRQKTMQAVADIIIREGKKLPKEKLLTITADNGKEFNDFKRIERKLHIKLYFAHTYASYERATNEQTNGMLRVFYPKGTDFTRVDEKEFQKVLRFINRKPRKSLGYLCAYEAFHGVRLNL